MPTINDIIAARRGPAAGLGQFYGFYGGMPAAAPVQRPMVPPQGAPMGVPAQRPMIPPQGVPAVRPGMARPMPAQAQGMPQFGPRMAPQAPIQRMVMPQPTGAASPGLAGLVGRPNIGRFYGG